MAIVIAFSLSILFNWFPFTASISGITGDFIPDLSPHGLREEEEGDADDDEHAAINEEAQPPGPDVVRVTLRDRRWRNRRVIEEGWARQAGGCQHETRRRSQRKRAEDDACKK